MKISNDIRIKVPTDFIDDSTKEFTDYFISEFSKKERSIREKIYTKISQVLNNHPVIRSLKGSNIGETDGSDLLAEFGLTSTMANSAIKKLKEKIKGNIKVNATNRSKSGYKAKSLITFGIELNDDYKQDLENEPFAYDSNEHGVRWMSYLVNSANHVISDFIDDISKYGIKYGDFKSSRTGDAIMTDRKNFADRFPYKLNKRFISFNGDNFIEDALNSPEFEQVVNDILEQFIEEFE